MKELRDHVEMSYGLIPLELGELTPELRHRGAKRVLKKLDVLELSPVLRGAAAQSGVLAIKASVPASPSRAEVEAIVAESRRILAMTSTSPLSPEESRDLLTKAQWALDCAPEAQVDSERHHAVTKLVAWGAGQWGVRPPSVKWYSRGATPDPDWRGVFKERDPGSIWLRSDLYSWDLLTTCLHELSHYARHIRELPQDETEVSLDAHHLVRRYVAEVVDAG
jgi:hypothetical protein